MASLGHPLSIQEITQQAANFQYNDRIKLRQWLRSADVMQREVGNPDNNIELYSHIRRRDNTKQKATMRKPTSSYSVTHNSYSITS